MFATGRLLALISLPASTYHGRSALKKSLVLVATCRLNRFPLHSQHIWMDIAEIGRQPWLVNGLLKDIRVFQPGESGSDFDLVNLIHPGLLGSGGRRCLLTLQIWAHGKKPSRRAGEKSKIAALY